MLPTKYMWPNPFKIIEFDELLRGVRITAEDVILDLGCGSGVQDFLLARKAQSLIGIDISSAQVERARRLADEYAVGAGVEFVCASLEQAQFPAEHFDKVVSFCVLEHMLNYDGVIAEAFRILRRGGVLLLSVDSLATIEDERLRLRHKADHYVHRYFRPSELQSLLEQAGFRRVAIHPIFRSRYAARVFARAIENGFHFSRYRKFGTYMRLRFEEWQHRHAGEGLFLCARATKPAS